MLKLARYLATQAVNKTAGKVASRLTRSKISLKPDEFEILEEKDGVLVLEFDQDFYKQIIEDAGEVYKGDPDDEEDRQISGELFVFEYLSENIDWDMVSSFAITPDDYPQKFLILQPGEDPFTLDVSQYDNLSELYDLEDDDDLDDDDNYDEDEEW